MKKIEPAIRAFHAREAEAEIEYSPDPPELPFEVRERELDYAAQEFSYSAPPLFI